MALRREMLLFLLYYPLVVILKTASDCGPNFNNYTITFFFKGLDIYENLSRFSRLHSLQIKIKALIEAELTEFISGYSFNVQVLCMQTHCHCQIL